MPRPIGKSISKTFFMRHRKGNITDVFRNPSCLNKTFQRIFCKVLDKSDVDVLTDLMSRSPKQTEYSITDRAHITKCPFDKVISSCTPVHWLCSLGLKQILELVLSRSDNKPEFINSLQGRVTPLHIAAGHGQLEVVKYLLEDIGVNVNEKLNETFDDEHNIDEQYAGCSPLHFAASQNFQEVVACLLQNEADPNLINDHGCSSMLLAARSGYKVVVDYLLRYGGNPNLSCNDGTTPLMSAAQEGHFDTMLTLIDGKADLNLQNNEEKSKQSALLLATRYGRIQCVKGLIEKGADKELSDIHGTSPLLVALLNEKYETAKYLFQLGASINAKNIEGKSPIEVTKSLNINLFDNLSG
ncbi:ANK [Mytilus coruscus]|uniref:ANK n=1 Tax=Mytilus coruscus TaxID=42192 RepID=A0A6J8DK43_MYTCO|nr:ANK [Mytilus coruscus]